MPKRTKVRVSPLLLLGRFFTPTYDVLRFHPLDDGRQLPAKHAIFDQGPSRYEQDGDRQVEAMSAQTWLTDMAHFADHNAAWNEWVDPKNPPVRACLLSPRLWYPGLLVEIMVTAAK